MARSKKTIVEDSEVEDSEVEDSEEDILDENDSSGEESEDDSEAVSEEETNNSEYETDEEQMTGGITDDEDEDEGQDQDEEDEDPEEEGGTDDENVTGVESDAETDEEAEGDEDDDVDGEGEVDYRPESRSCHLKDLNKEIPLDEDDSDIYGKLEWSRVPDEDRMTDPKMTFYEMVGIIGIRAQQFSCGAPPLIEGIDHLPPHKMAYLELITGLTPFIVSRKLPNKRYEEWFVDELTIDHKINDTFFEVENFNQEELMERAAKILDEYRARRASSKA